MNKDFYIISTMVDTSLAFEAKAKEEKVKMFASIFAFFIVLFIMICSFFLLSYSYGIIAFLFIEVVGSITCFILNNYRKSCKSYLLIYRKELHNLFASIFEYERIIDWNNEFEKHLIKQRLLLVNPNV